MVKTQSPLARAHKVGYLLVGSADPDAAKWIGRYVAARERRGTYSIVADYGEKFGHLSVVLYFNDEVLINQSMRQMVKTFVDHVRGDETAGQYPPRYNRTENRTMVFNFVGRSSLETVAWRVDESLRAVMGVYGDA